jgi:citrate synthase
MERMLSSEEAARRLGVKVSTVYAYVSRGVLESHRDPAGRGSLFDLGEIERLAQRSRVGRQTESRLATVTTGVTQLHQHGGPFYRGRAATEIVGRQSFEDVTALLWEEDTPGDWATPDLGPCPLTSTLDRLRWAIVLCGATDALRADARPLAVTRSARRVIATMTSVVGDGSTAPGAPGVPGVPGAPEASIAVRLAQRLAAGNVAPVAAAIDAALILMADHELATSTMAVRVAASTRADIYDALLAGLATLAGPLHGGASQQAFELLAAAERDGVVPALNDALRLHRLLPGFGHMVYKHGDARFGALLALTEPVLSPARRDILREVIDLADVHDVPLPNCDLALAVLSWGAGMPPDSGRTIFSIARVAGWTAHYLEELSERPLRFRARAVYSVERSASGDGDSGGMAADVDGPAHHT